MIVDTHVHIVAEDQRKYPRNVASFGQGWVRDMPVSAEGLLQRMQAAGIDRTALVQAYGAYAYDNSYIADSAARYSDRFVGICILDPLPRDAPEQLTHWVKERGVRGLRLFTSTESEGTWLDDPSTFPMWERAASLGIPVCVWTRFPQALRLAVPLQRFPQVPVALDHMGMPELDEGPPYRSIQPLFDLARFPNLHLKFSTVSVYAARKGKSTPKEFFRRALDLFGPRRMMWGSNFPATYNRGLKEQLDLAREALAFLPEEDRRWLFGETALTLWPMLRGTKGVRTAPNPPPP